MSNANTPINPKLPSFGARLVSSPVQIWSSRLSWKIAAAAFLTIMLVQAVILALTIEDFERRQLGYVREKALSALIPAFDQVPDSPFETPLSQQEESRLLTDTGVKGIAVYNANYDLLRLAGEPVVLTLSPGSDLNATHRSRDGTRYERVFRPSDLSRMPYFVVARMNAESVNTAVRDHVRDTILIMALMSALVTTVLMIALGTWLLEPMLFLRASLRLAADDPENPRTPASPYDPRDEVGSAILMAQDLIAQNARNIRQIKSAAEDQIHRLAYYDSLTGLPNRTLFLRRLAHATSQAGGLPEDGEETGEAADSPEESGGIRRMAVVALDLDHFKDINDSMGHHIGDMILCAVGKRLRAALPEKAVVARSGEDEFAIMMPLDESLSTARAVGEKIQAAIRNRPFQVYNENFQIRASVGVATYPDNGTEPDRVLKNADIALNRAKEEGRDTLREYLEDFNRVVRERFQMLRDLRDALENGELDVYYHPQLELSTGRVIGAEALIRWWKPDNSRQGGTMIKPDQFISIAEQSGLIVPIGEWVMRTACAAARRWHQAGHGIRIAVNVSGAQFHQSDLVANTARIIEETGIDPRLLELEVTESVFMDDIQNTIRILQNLHAMGVELAIDDFGTGYSSLSYLRQFPIDRLKIDQSFILNALNNPDDASIARTIVGLAHSLNLKVIAEGVETRDHEEFLRREGCDEVQGFRYARPMPEAEFDRFLAAYTGDVTFFDHLSPEEMFGAPHE